MSFVSKVPFIFPTALLSGLAGIQAHSSHGIKVVGSGTTCKHQHPKDAEGDRLFLVVSFYKQTNRQNSLPGSPIPKYTLLHISLGKMVLWRSPGEGNGNPLQHSWRIPWTEESGGLQSMGSQESDTTEQLSTHTHSFCPNHCLVAPWDGLDCLTGTHGLRKENWSSK